MRMRTVKTLLLVNLLLVFFSCSKQKGDGELPRAGNYTTAPFLAGNIGNRAVYWAGGQPVYLTDGHKNAGGMAMFISRQNNAVQDIYVAGYIGGEPCYWKNGELHLLPTNGLSGIAKSIYVAGNKVYVAGVVSHELTANAAMWEGDKLTLLDLGDAESNAAGISVYKGVVYVAGYTTVDTRIRACIWKNGALQLMPFSLDKDPNNKYDGSMSQGIFIDKGDVYITGVENHWNLTTTAAYWKGSKRVYLENTFGGAVGESIFKLNNDIYVSGYRFIDTELAAYWKNGKIKLLSNNPSEARAIVVGKDHVYIGGNELTNGVLLATCWVDGTAIRLSDKESDVHDVKLGQVFVNF